ncbi:hypothetical protein M2333_002659 [Sphingobium sp. B11D3B]|uniref:HTH domain-containing protein n=1 Tax=Sphingobium sp. B11D3B TaxID=2940575 RepID=UPI002227A060|nr:hypothetical protein [Sphingobium sp. B11D3B]MCW2389613.1 hypothetical protein [Sphingobium sp. B11D3B]
MQAAALATTVKHPDGKALLIAAVAKDENDARVLASAFGLSIRRGEDGEEPAISWFKRAVELSDETGPFIAQEPRKFIEYHQEAVERSDRLDAMLRSGEVTMSMAAGPLGTTLTAMILRHAATNIDQPDARKRVYLPIYAGSRIFGHLGAATRIAIEPTALLVLHLLDALEPVFEAFDTVVLPAGTLPSLLEDLMGNDHGQPSRAVRATKVLDLVKRRKLIVIERSDGDSDKVEALQALAQAENGRIVHIPPLYEPGSFNEIIRDAAPFAAHLASIAAVVDALRARGEISAAEAANAERFPDVRQRWADEAAIDLDRPLILDPVALHFLVDAGLVEPLTRLNVRLLVLPDVATRAEAELQERETVNMLQAQVERFRETLSAALRSGKAVVGSALYSPRSPGVSESDEELDGEDDVGEENEPLSAILQDSCEVDALIADDRFINQHGLFTDNSGRQASVATSIDLLITLKERGLWTEAALLAALQKIRAAGIGLAPISADEIVAAVESGDWQSGPPRAIRIIRDSLVLPFLRRAILYPLERPWVERAVFQLCLAIKECFRKLQPEAAARAAEFLHGAIPDLLALNPNEPANADHLLWGRGIQTNALGLLAMPLNMTSAQLNAYHAWFDQSILERLKGKDADLVNDIVARLKEIILKHREQMGESGELPTLPPEELTRWLTAHLPVIFRTRLLGDDEFRLMIDRRRAVSVGGFRVPQDALSDFLREVLSGEDAVLRDAAGEQVAVGGIVREDHSISIDLEEGRLVFTQAGLFSADPDIRSRSFISVLEGYSIAPSRERYWRGIVDSGPFDSATFVAFTSEVQNSVEHFCEKKIEEMAGPDFEIHDLVRLPETYFLNFAESLADAPSLKEGLQVLADDRRTGASVEATAVASAPLAVIPGFDLEAFTGPLGPEDAAGLALRLLEKGDPFSILAGFGLVAKHVGHPACRAIGDRILDEMWSEAGTARDLAHDFCVGAMLVTTDTGFDGTLRNWPVFGRRAAILAHAGAICRVLRHFEIQRPALLNQVTEWIGSQYDIVVQREAAHVPGLPSPTIIPLAVEAQLLVRFDQVIDSIPLELRPAPWLEILRARVARFDGPLAGFLYLPGPLDAFGNMPPTLPVPAEEDVAVVLEFLGEEPSEGTPELLLRLAMFYAAPDSETAQTIGDAALAQAKRAEIPLRDQYHGILLQLAQSWAMPGLAEALADLIPVENCGGAGLVHQALMISSAYHDEQEQIEALQRQLMRAGQLAAIGLKSRQVTRSIQALLNADPSLVPHLQAALRASTLGL